MQKRVEFDDKEKECLIEYLTDYINDTARLEANILYVEATDFFRYTTVRSGLELVAGIEIPAVKDFTEYVALAEIERRVLEKNPKPISDYTIRELFDIILKRIESDD